MSIRGERNRNDYTIAVMLIFTVWLLVLAAQEVLTPDPPVYPDNGVEGCIRADGSWCSP